MAETQPNTPDMQILEAAGVPIKKEEFDALPVKKKQTIVKDAWALTSSLGSED